jgi:microcystin-dependent protein
VPRHERNDAPEKRGPGRPPQVAVRLEPAAAAVHAARQAPQRLVAPRAPVTQHRRASGHASPCVAVERGVRRTGQLLAGDLPAHSDTLHAIARNAGLRQTCRDRSATAARVGPKRQAPSACVSHDVRRQVSQLGWAQTASSALHAPLMPSYSLDRVAATQPITQGESLRALAERIRPPLLQPNGALGALSPLEHNQLQHKAQALAAVCQRSSSTGAGRNGYVSLRNHQLRGLAPPRTRAGLTAVQNFFLTRADGTTAAERCFGQKPRSMCAAIVASVELPPAPLSPPRRAVG